MSSLRWAINEIVDLVAGHGVEAVSRPLDKAPVAEARDERDVYEIIPEPGLVPLGAALDPLLADYDTREGADASVGEGGHKGCVGCVGVHAKLQLRSLRATWWLV